MDANVKTSTASPAEPGDDQPTSNQSPLPPALHSGMHSPTKLHEGNQSIPPAHLAEVHDLADGSDLFAQLMDTNAFGVPGEIPYDLLNGGSEYGADSGFDDIKQAAPLPERCTAGDKLSRVDLPQDAPQSEHYAATPRSAPLNSPPDVGEYQQFQRQCELEFQQQVDRQELHQLHHHEAQSPNPQGTASHLEVGHSQSKSHLDHDRDIPHQTQGMLPGRTSRGLGDEHQRQLQWQYEDTHQAQNPRDWFHQQSEYQRGGDHFSPYHSSAPSPKYRHAAEQDHAPRHNLQQGQHSRQEHEFHSQSGQYQPLSPPRSQHTYRQRQSPTETSDPHHRRWHSQGGQSVHYSRNQPYRRDQREDHNAGQRGGRHISRGSGEHRPRRKARLHRACGECHGYHNGACLAVFCALCKQKHMPGRNKCPPKARSSLQELIRGVDDLGDELGDRLIGRVFDKFKSHSKRALDDDAA